MKKLLKTRKLLTLTLCAILAMALIAGCDNSKSGSGSGDTATTPPATTEPANDATASGAAAEPEASGDAVEITYSFWGTPDEAAEVQKVADTFNAEQSKVKVKVTDIPHDTYVSKLNTMAAANELPDCGIMSEAGVLQFASQGLLADISSMYEGATSAPLESLAFKSDGKTVAYSAANEVLILYYNKKMFDDAKVDYPPAAADKAWTWDEFVAAAKKLTIDSSGKTADQDGFDSKNIKQYGAMVENLTWQLEVWALSNGGGFYSADGSAVTIDSKETTDAIQKVADLYLKDHVAPLSTGLTDDGVQRSLVAGTVAMTTNGTWNVGTSLPDWVAEGNEYGVAVLPKMQESVTICTGGPNVVFSQSKNPEAAMEWIKWYSQESNNWGLIESGIWMPILAEYYTDEALTKKWVENPNFPAYDQYKTAVVDYARENSKSTSWYYVNNTNDFNDLLGATLGDVWTGAKTAEEAIKEKIDALKAAYEGNA